MSSTRPHGQKSGGVFSFPKVRDHVTGQEARIMREEMAPACVRKRGPYARASVILPGVFPGEGNACPCTPPLGGFFESLRSYWLDSPRGRASLGHCPRFVVPKPLSRLSFPFARSSSEFSARTIDLPSPYRRRRAPFCAAVSRSCSAPQLSRCQPYHFPPRR